MTCGIVLLVALLQPVGAQEQEYILEIWQDNYKVVFISGNLTAAATYAWPRVVFYHSTSLLSPHFEVGFPKFYLFNDTNQNGLFDRDETVYYGYFDEHHVLWNLTVPELGENPALGQFGRFGMRTTVGLYSSPLNHTPLIEEWARASFWFNVVENDEVFVNTLGEYTVQGKLEMRVNFTLEVVKPMNVTCLAMEQSLQGGGTTQMFLLRELVAKGQESMTMVSGRVDESPTGLNVTHELRETPRPRQEVRFAKEDWTTQAFYYFSSEYLTTYQDNTSMFQGARSTYHTTGTGLVLHSVYLCGNDTSSVSSGVSVGIDESGFAKKVTDWFKENLWRVLAISSAVVVIVTVTALWALKRWRARACGPEEEPHDEKQGP